MQKLIYFMNSMMSSIVSNQLDIMKLVKNHKQIYDNIHGPIPISNYACRVIDKHEFERLRYLHQLGPCYYVFPSATHTRFEHSVGTYFLAGWILDSIRNNSLEIHIND